MTSAKRTARWRQNRKERENYNEAAEREKKTILRIRKIRERQRKDKCPLGRKCKDKTCSKQEDRDRKREQPKKIGMKSPKERGKLERKKNTRQKEEKIQALMVKIKDLVNEKKRRDRADQKLEKSNRKRKRTEDRFTDIEISSSEWESENEESCDTHLIMSSSLLSVMSPVTKKKTFRRLSYKDDFQEVKKQPRKEGHEIL